MKTILRRTKDDPQEITEDFLFQKANEMSSFQELLKAHTIKKKYLIRGTGQCPTLTILTEKKNKEKKKDKKKKQKNVDSDMNSEAVQ